MLSPDERGRLAAHLEGDGEWCQRKAALEARITLPRLRERRIYEEMLRYAIMMGLIRPERVAELGANAMTRPIRYPTRDGVV